MVFIMESDVWFKFIKEKHFYKEHKINLVQANKLVCDHEFSYGYFFIFSGEPYKIITAI